jgi:hypothetical protein
VSLDSALADKQLLGDLAGGSALGCQERDLTFAWAEA